MTDFFGIVRRNLWLLVVGALVMAVPITYSVMRAPPVYHAEGLVRLIDMRGAMTGGLPDQMMGRNADAILSHVEVLRGRYVIGQVVDEEGLRLASATVGFPVGMLGNVRVDDDATARSFALDFQPNEVRVTAGARTLAAPYGQPVTLDGVTFTVRERPTGAEEADLYVLPREAAIDVVLARLGTIPRDRTDAVAISYSAADPITAQRVVNAVVRTFQNANASTAQEESRRQRLFLEARLAETDSLLRDAEAMLTSYRTDRQFYSSREMVMGQQQSLMDLDTQRALLTSERQMYGSLLAQLASGDAAGQTSALQTLVSSPGIASNPVVTNLHMQLTQYRQERDALTTGPAGLSAANDRVQMLNGLIQIAQGELQAAIRSHINAVDAQIAALGNLRGQTAQQMSTLPQTEIEEMRLVQQAEAVRGVADQLAADLQRARMAEAVEVGQVQVVYEAPLPLEPADNGLLWKVTLGLILGMLLGSGGAVLRESMNTAIRQPNEIERNLGLPELAVVPHATQPGRLGRRSGGAAKLESGTGRPDLAMLQGTGAIGAEAYRMLRTNLLYAQARNGLSTLAVTSPAPGEGKTTTVANLAVAFAQQGQRVLVVDCDLRRPRLHKVFGVEAGPGLTDVLTGAVTLREALRDTQIEDLTLVTAGGLTDAPAELLGSDRMSQLIKFLSEGFDLVLLDTPPVLAAAEAISLSTLVDGVVLVVRAGQTDRRDARDAVQQLTDVGATVFGAVLNDPDSTMAEHGRGYKYYKYYSGAAS